MEGTQDAPKQFRLTGHMIIDLAIRNYKSLRDVRLHGLPAFSVLVGANASGKSNFVDALDFLSLVVRSGLAAAIRTKGGYENICFRRARRSKAGIEFDLTAVVPLFRERRRRASPLKFHYSFGFKATTEAITADYKVTHEKITVTKPDSSTEKLEIVRDGNEVSRVSISKNAETTLHLPGSGFFRDWVHRARLLEDDLLWPTHLDHFPPFLALSHFLGTCRVYQISPEMAREPGIPERSPELGRHGENLPAAVDFLKRSHRQAFEELVSHLQHAVSTMESIETGYVETKELGLFFKERGVGRRWYAQDVSDGTLKTVSLFVPLVDPRVEILAIEEPENSLHPWILRHFIEVCKGTQKQIWVTTHSPVALDAVPPESLFIVRRIRGETSVERLETLYPEAKQVLEEQLYGLGEYWERGAISGVPEPEAALAIGGNG